MPSVPIANGIFSATYSNVSGRSSPLSKLEPDDLFPFYRYPYLNSMPKAPLSCAGAATITSTLPIS